MKFNIEGKDKIGKRLKELTKEFLLGKDLWKK